MAKNRLTNLDRLIKLTQVDERLGKPVGGAQVEGKQARARPFGPFLVKRLGHEVARVDRHRGTQRGQGGVIGRSLQATLAVRLEFENIHAQVGVRAQAVSRPLPLHIVEGARRAGGRFQRLDQGVERHLEIARGGVRS